MEQAPSVSLEMRIDLVSHLLKVSIADIGYPVGCGMSPHPETLRKIAEHCVRVATAPDAEFAA